jgi:hypothetical protein
MHGGRQDCRFMVAPTLLLGSGRTARWVARDRLQTRAGASDLDISVCYIQYQSGYTTLWRSCSSCAGRAESWTPALRSWGPRLKRIASWFCK